MTTGTLIGIHAEQSSQTVPLVRRAHDAGVRYAAVLAHENPGLCMDVKSIEPRTLTIARWANPNTRWEGGQEVATWSEQERLDFARASIQLIFDRTNDQEYHASDYFCMVNEWDAPEPDGWAKSALAWLALLDEADRRSPEMTARGLHPIRLAIPGQSQGTPEYFEMVDVVGSGLFERMRARGDIFILHEGVFWEEPIELGFGDLIPGAPRVPIGGGSRCGRFNYWYSLNVRVPFVVTEFYDGKRRDAATPGQQQAHNLERLRRITWYDKLVRQNPFALGFCCFELTDDAGSPWRQQDYTPVFQTPEMLAYMVAEKDKPNVAPVTPASAKIIDVSRWQGVIDWPTVRAAGVETAIIRATLGATGVDSEYRRNWSGARAAGIPNRGVYHYVITSNIAQAQVANILQTTGGDFGNEPLTLDCEPTETERQAGNFPKAAYTAMVRQMLDLLTPVVAVRIYTSASAWAFVTTEPEWAIPFLEWLADYRNVPSPALPAHVTTWRRWQYSSTGRVAGIVGDVDLNRDNAPAPPLPVPTGDLDMADRARIDGHLDSIWLEMYPKVKAHNPCPLFNSRGGSLNRTLTDGRNMDVFGKVGGWLLVFRAPELWARVTDVDQL